MSAESTLTLTSSPEIKSDRFSSKTNRQLAQADILQGLAKWRIWLLLAYQDVKLRYRRSVIGPFWITLSMAITAYSMGYLYGHLFHTQLQTYFPFLVAGMISWALISSQITELSESLTSSEALIKQIKLPLSLFVHRTATRNMIIFFHNIIVIVPILIIFHEAVKVNLNTLMLFPNLLIIYVNCICYGLVLAMIGARYRDMAQIIKSLIQVVFFLTPVMWGPSLLSPSHRYVFMLNPFYSFVELVRAPMMGLPTDLHHYFMVGVVTILGIALCTRIFVPYRARVVYWL